VARDHRDSASGPVVCGSPGLFAGGQQRRFCEDVLLGDDRLRPSQRWVTGRLPRWARDLAAAAEPIAHRA